MIAGVDGYAGGWLAAVDHTDDSTRIRTYPSFAALAAAADLTTIVIDCPIGLMEFGPRQADLEARQRLGPRRNSVFPAPIRAVLDASSYEEACARWSDAEGKKCSRQLYAILPKITDVDAHMTPTLQQRIREGHPELSFWALNAGAPMAEYKGTLLGQRERLDALQPHFPGVEQKLKEHRALRAEIDIVDAFAMLWTARRLAAGVSESIPTTEQRDRRGLRVEMVY